jgi:hypothetical protein
LSIRPSGEICFSKPRIVDHASRYAAVAYAGGGHAKGLGYDDGFIDELLARHGASELLYFGDLDAAHGGIALAPAAGLYAWLLANGRPVRSETRERLQAEDLAWLSEPFHAQVASLCAAGERIAQEWLGTRALFGGLADSWWPRLDAPVGTMQR